MINLSQLEWHPARPGSRYMIRYAVLDEATRVAEAIINEGGPRYLIQRKGAKGEWRHVGPFFRSLHEALEGAGRIPRARGGSREGAGRKPGARPVQAGRISADHHRMLERMAAHRGQSIRQALEAAIWEAYQRMRVEWDPSREFPLGEEGA